MSGGYVQRSLSETIQPGKAFFIDMVHSNNAARIRLWLRLKSLEDKVDSKMIVYADLQSDGFLKYNPTRKVPAFITENGDCLFESYVIMQYLEDKYGHLGPSMLLDTPEDRAFVNLLVRVHDIYISSPNCTQPNFAHTQGCMYLPPYETKHAGKARAMDRPTRAAKLAEIWKQLTWLEGQVKGPYMAGERVTHADMTWFPTVVFMEFMLPRVFSWPAVFHETEHFPKLTAWFAKCSESPIFQAVHKEIWDFWAMKEEAGQFTPILDEVKDPGYKWKYP